MALDKNDIKTIKEIFDQSSLRLEERLMGKMDVRLEQTKEEILVKTEMMIDDQTRTFQRELDDIVETQREIIALSGNKSENYDKRISRPEKKVDIRAATN